MFGKLCRIGLEWKWVELTKEEIADSLEIVANDNKFLLQNCLDEACDIMENKKLGRDSDTMVKIATSLFERIGTSSYTELIHALDYKINQMREKAIEDKKALLPEAQKKREETLKKLEEPKKKEPSKVEQAFEAESDGVIPT